MLLKNQKKLRIFRILKMDQGHQSLSDENVDRQHIQTGSKVSTEHGKLLKFYFL